MTETAVISMAPLTAALGQGVGFALLTSPKVLDQEGKWTLQMLFTDNRKCFVAFG